MVVSGFPVGGGCPCFIHAQRSLLSWSGAPRRWPSSWPVCGPRRFNPSGRSARRTIDRRSCRNRSRLFGKVVDAETGKPVEAFITQAGKFDPKDPKNVTWGFSETRNTSGGFRATIKWNEGWTARILADGYVPQPVLSEAPPAGKARIETVIRLKKGRTVRGRVVDHLGKPVKDASVFAVRPTA